MKRIMIGTPVYGSLVAAEFAQSLAVSMVEFYRYGLQGVICMAPNHSLVQMGRNQIFTKAVDEKVDDLVWIDADMTWDPMDLLKLCLHEEDVVGATYRKKLAKEEYTVQLLDKEQTPDERGLIEVNRIGTGFLRISRKAMLAVTKDSKGYKEYGRDAINAFEVGFLNDDEFLSEDFFFCEKLKAKGFKIMLDTRINLGHCGGMKYDGNFSEFLKKGK